MANLAVGRNLGAGTASEAARQYAALPYRRLGELSILLVTSRETGRWVLPKGWPMKGKKPQTAAAREALEEAGVIGQIVKRPVGAYSYAKRLAGGGLIDCVVDVFPLEVQRQLKHWPEQLERVTRWFTPLEAANAVREPELAQLITGFAATFVADAAA
jgi:8-oxo-dGTP pyrophosphatase MutT (NUDIX family)